MASGSTYASILQAIDEGRNALLRSRLSRGLTRFVCVAAVVLALVVVWGILQQAFSIHRVSVVAAVSLGAVLAMVLALVKWVILPVVTMPDRNGFVNLVEKRYPEAKNILVNSYQLGSDEALEKHAGSQDLIQAVVAKAHRSLESFDLKTWSSPREDMKFIGFGTVSAVVLVVLALTMASSFRQALAQAVNPGLAAPPPVFLTVLPGNATVDRGADLAVAVVVEGTGKAPTLRFREPGGDWRLAAFKAQGMISRQGGSWEANLERIERTIEYAVVAPRAESEIFSVLVNDPPRLQGFRMHVRYPAYTHLPPESMESASGDITVLKGSQVDVRVLTNVSVAAGYLEWQDDNREAPDRIELEALDTTQWSANISVMGAGSYAVVFSSASGNEVLRSPRYRVDPLLDRVPFMTLHLPQEDHDLYSDMMERVLVDAADDYGFSAAEIVYRLDDGPEQVRSLRPFVSGQTEFRLDTLWDLSGLNLIPGQVVSFYVRIVDNDVITGPKAVQSDMRHVRFPTVAELYNEVAEEHSQEIDNLAKLQESQEEMQKRLEKLSDDLKQGQKRDWDAEQEVQTTLERQAELENQVEEVVRRLTETMEKAESRAEMSQSLVQKMGQLNELLESLANEDLKRSFQRLSNALSKQSSDELRKAMEDFQSQQEQMLAGLERTIELLKQIRKEEHVDDVVRRAEEIAKLQEEIAKEMEALGGVPPESGEDPQDPSKDPKDSPEGERAGSEDPENSKDGDSEPSVSSKELPQELKDLQKEISQLEKELSEELKKNQKAGEQSQESQSEGQNPGQSQEKQDHQSSEEGEQGESQEAQEAADRTKEMEQQLESLKEAMEKALAQAQENAASDQENPEGEQSSSQEGEKSKQGDQNQQNQQGEKSQSGEQGEQGEKSQSGQQDQQQEGEQQGESDTEEEQQRMEELAQKQEELREKFEDLKRRLEQLQKMHEDDQRLAQDLEKMEKGQNSQDLSKSMQESQQGMNKGQKQKSTFYSFKAKEEASRLAEMAESAQQNMEQGLQDDTIAMMEALIQGLIDISRVEEVLVVDPHEDEREQARHQFDLVEQTQAMSESLAVLSRKTFSVENPDQRFLDETIARMERATRLYELGNRRAGNHESKVSVSDLNTTIVKLMKGHQQMCGGGGGGGSMQQLMEQMQGLSQAQEQLNQQAGRASQNGGNRLSQTERKRLDWLAAQQEMIRQGLEEVRKEFSESKELLGDMEALGQEMQEVESELLGHNLDKRILERQQKILSRLLDAQRSVRQQEMSPKRQSKTGTLARRDAPPPIPKELVQKNRALEEDVLRGSQDRYPVQYRKLVEDYFKALTEQTRTP